MSEPTNPEPAADPTRELHARQAVYCDDCGMCLNCYWDEPCGGVPGRSHAIPPGFTGED